MSTRCSPEYLFLVICSRVSNNRNIYVVNDTVFNQSNIPKKHVRDSWHDLMMGKIRWISKGV